MREIEASSSNRIKDSGDDADEEAEMEFGTTDGVLDAFDLVAEIGSDADNDNAVGGNGGWQAGEKTYQSAYVDPSISRGGRQRMRSLRGYNDNNRCSRAISNTIS